MFLYYLIEHRPAFADNCIPSDDGFGRGRAVRGAEGEAENSQAKGPDTGRYSGKRKSTDEAQSFRSKDRAHEQVFCSCAFLDILMDTGRADYEGG